tara:strand:- start:130 stop:1248 length:1119 start_codon:yes stop_codon:yes gene_type:complete
MSKAADLANLIGNINAGGGGVNRNVIINGAMNVAQRGTSFADVSGGTYTLDRFIRFKNHDGAVTITQDSSGPDGFSNSLKVDVTTADTNLTGTQNEIFGHKIEAQNLQSLAFGTSSAKNFTVSFYVKSNKTGTYALNVVQSDNSSKSATLNYTIDSANTWERKSVTFTGDASGVINDDNGIGFEMSWFLAAGPTYTSGSASASFATFSNANYAAGQTVNLLDSTDNEWFITGVQLEVGQNPTSFEHEPFERTLAKCQRYLYSHNTATDNNGSTFSKMMVGANMSSTLCRATINFPCEMRVKPALTTGTVSGMSLNHGSNSNTALSAISLNANSNKIATTLECTVSSGLTAGDAAILGANNNDTAFILLDSEL